MYLKKIFTHIVNNNRRYLLENWQNFANNTLVDAQNVYE